MPCSLLVLEGKTKIEDENDNEDEVGNPFSDSLLGREP